MRDNKFIKGIVVEINERKITIDTNEKRLDFNINKSVEYRRIEIKKGEKEEVLNDERISQNKINKGDNVVIYFRNNSSKNDIEAIKKFIAQGEGGSCGIDKLSEIAVYYNLIDYYIKKPEKLIDKGEEVLLDFYLPNQLPPSPEVGVKIKKLIDKLNKQKYSFVINSIPPCFLTSVNLDYENILADRENGQKFPVFCDENFIVYYPNPLPEKEKNSSHIHMTLYCQNCSFFKNDKCGGVIYFSGGLNNLAITSNWIEEKFSEKKELVLLDCGCGFNSNYLNFYTQNKDKFQNIYLLDPSDERLKAAKKYVGDESFSFLSQNSEDMEFKENYFDIVIMSSSYNHIKDIESTMNRVKSSLKKDGFLLISDECGDYHNHLHERNHDLDGASLFLRSLGFKILDFKSDDDGDFWIMKATPEL